ncbi:hypothetical protein [Paraburkholderia sp.]|uniref:hypothetical protein n=1 Tax=Paraburkholderia sp. TaxID=1926495 RepID=UPI002399681E|nr:hypothetical protein [Paraburkholderia sp.]MDE1184299.1 hypothetical protein [Paraburkholderia sp.]
MNTLIIKDLTVIESLDRRAMYTVRGGFQMPSFDYFNFNPLTMDFSKHVTASQSNTTYMSINALGAPNSTAGVVVTPTVSNANTIYQG